MVDPFQIALTVITVFSALFVAITGGLKLTLGYRGSEETVSRKNRIDVKLRQEIEEKINQFTESDECRKDGKKRIDRFQELGYEGYIAENITTDILEKATSLIGNALKLMVGATVPVSLTVYIAFVFDLTQILSIIIFVFYVLLTIFYSWRVVSGLRKAHFLMKKFILLDENATLEYATELHSELVDKGLV